MPIIYEAHTPSKILPSAVGALPSGRRADPVPPNSSENWFEMVFVLLGVWAVPAGKNSKPTLAYWNHSKSPPTYAIHI